MSFTTKFHKYHFFWNKIVYKITMLKEYIYLEHHKCAFGTEYCGKQKYVVDKETLLVLNLFLTVVQCFVYPEGSGARVLGS